MVENENAERGKCPAAHLRGGGVESERGVGASQMSRLACSQRLASLRFGTGMAGCARLMPIPRFGPSSLLTTARRFSDVTPRLFATAGFPPIRDRHGGLCPPYAYPSLRSIQPAHDGSALRVSQSSAARRRRKKIQSRVFRGHAPEENTLLRGDWVTIPKESNPVSPAYPHKSPWTFVRRLTTARRFSDVTPRLFTTPGFPPIRDRHGGLCPPYAYPSLRSIRAVHDGSALRFPAAMAFSWAAGGQSS